MHQYGTRRYSHQSPVATASTRLSAGPSSSISRSRRSPIVGTSSTDSILNSYRTSIGAERRLSQSNDSYSALASSSAQRSPYLSSRPAASSGSDYLRPTRYDSYYSRNSKDTSYVNGRSDSAASRYISPSISTAGSGSGGRYLTNASSRDSSFSSSWPSPVRKDILSLTSDTASGYYRSSPSRRDVPNYSSTPSIAGSTVGLYRPYDSEKTSVSRCGTPSSRRNSLSYTNYLDTSNVGSRLSTDYDRTRRYSGTGTSLGLTDTNGHLGLSSRMTTALNGYSSRGADSSASGRLSRSGSRTSFSPMPQSSVPPPSPLKTSWSKHYSSISSQWAENTGSKINAKSQYNYRPTVSTKFEINANAISTGLSSKRDQRNVGGGVGRKSPKIRKKDVESDGYDSSSSNNDDHSRSTDVTQRSTGSRTKRRSHRKAKSSTANNLLTAGGTDCGSKTHNIKVQISNDDAKKSSSDEEPSSFYDSVDARIKARRRRLQKSKNMLQEQKEDSWAHRRALQMEEAKTRTFEHLLSPKTEIERRQEQRRNSKGTLETTYEPSKLNGEDHSDMASVSSSYTRKHTIQPLPLAAWRSSTSAGKSSLSPAKSSVSPERSQSLAVDKVCTDNGDMQLNQNQISKRTDFNYNEYVSCIAPKKDHSMYESPSLLILEADQELLKQTRSSKIVKYESPNSLLLETDQEHLKQARESKLANDIPKTVLDFRKSLSPKKDNSLKPIASFNGEQSREASLDKNDEYSVKYDLVTLKTPQNLLSEKSPNKNFLDQNYNEIQKIEEVKKEKEKVTVNSVPHGKRIVITVDQPSKSSVTKKEAEDEKSIKSVMNIIKTDDVDDKYSSRATNNKNLAEDETAERNERKATVEREKSTSSVENTKNMNVSTNDEKLFEDDDDLNSINKTSQFPVAKPRKSLQQKSKIRLVNDDAALPTSSSPTNKISTPTRDLSPKISAVILEEIKIETIPLINTTIVEPKRNLSPKISVVISEEKKQPEVEPPKMSVVMFERQSTRPMDIKAKSPTKKLPAATDKAAAQTKIAAKASTPAGNQAKIETKKEPPVAGAAKGPAAIEKQKTPELKVKPAPVKEKSVEKQRTPDRKNVEKQKTPEKKNVEKQKTPERKNVEKQKTPERKTIEKQKTPERVKATSTNELEPKTTLQSNKLKVVNKPQSTEPTVIKVRKQQVPESSTLVQIKKSPDKKPAVSTANKESELHTLSASQPASKQQLALVNGSNIQKKEVSPSAEFKAQLNPNLLVDATSNEKVTAPQTKSAEPHLVNGTDKIEEPSPTVSHGSETKISSGQLVNHAPGTKISVHILNQTPDRKPAAEPGKAMPKTPEALKPINLILQEALNALPSANHVPQDFTAKENQLLDQVRPQGFQAALQQYKQPKIEQPPTSATKLVAQLKLIEEREKNTAEQNAFYDSFQDYKRQVPQKTDPSVYELHRLPSVDREMLSLLTLGEELNASRSSLHTAESHTPANSAQPSPKRLDQYSNKQAFNLADNSSWKGSRESLNSASKFNNAAKPWRSIVANVRDREGSIHSIDSMSSFATAATHMKGSKESLNDQQQKPEQFNNQGMFEVIRVGQKSQVSNMAGLKSQSKIPASTNATNSNLPSFKNVAPQNQQPSAPLVNTRQGKSSLDQASKRVDEMLKLARMKHDENKTNFKEATDELDEVYEQIKQEYASEQQMRKNNRAVARTNKLGSQNALDTKSHLVPAFNPPIASPNLSDFRWPELSSKGSLNSSRKDLTITSSNQMSDMPVKSGEGFLEYDQIKMDYTKRWLEGDLKSLTRDPKPDLLQFGSQTRIEADQRSIGSASAEVAAITNKDRLHALRVPDIVPQKHEILKPSAILSQSHHQSIIQQAQAMLKNTSMQSYATSEPSHYPNAKSRQILAEHIKVYDMVQNEKQDVLPKREIGTVKKQVDMFDRMSDNESERSFLSDNLAYKSSMNKFGRRVSLTDHIAGFIRRFESDEALGVFNKNLQESNMNKPHYVVGNDYVKVPQRRMHPSGGSTHSLPIIQPPAGPAYRNYPASSCRENIPGQWQKVNTAWSSKYNHGLGMQQQYLNVPAQRDHQWSSNSTLTDLDICEAFADPPQSSLPAGKPAYLNKNYLQNVDNIVAELTLHTEDRPQIAQHRFPVSPKASPARQLSLGIDDGSNPTGSNFQRMTARQMLNVIPEYNENYENIQYAQKMLEDARRELKPSSATFVSNTYGTKNIQGPYQSSNGKLMHSNSDAQHYHQQPPYVVRGPTANHNTNGEPSFNHSAIRTDEAGYTHSGIRAGGQAYKYSNNNSHFDLPPELPPRNQSSSFVMKSPGNAQYLKARHAQRQSWHEPSFSERMAQQREDDYDNITHLRTLNAQKEQQIANPRLHSPNMINIGNVHLNKEFSPRNEASSSAMSNGHSEPELKRAPSFTNKADVAETSSSKNPIKNLFNMFNRSSSKNEKEKGALPKDMSLKGSSVSLNVVSLNSVKMPEKIHKSNSISESTKLKSGARDVDLQQLDELLVSMQGTKGKEASAHVALDNGKDSEKKKFKLGWSLWKR